MTLAAALTAYAEVVGESLVNDCDASVPSRVLRYHGHAPPDEMECGDGILAVWWAPSITSASLSSLPCPGYPVVDLHARWVVCWKIPEINQSGVTLYDTTWDTDAAFIADVAECVSRTLMRLSCDVPPGGPGHVLRSLAVGNSLKFVDARPVGAMGGVAGVAWTTRIGLRADTPTS